MVVESIKYTSAQGKPPKSTVVVGENPIPFMVVAIPPASVLLGGVIFKIVGKASFLNFVLSSIIKEIKGSEAQLASLILIIRSRLAAERSTC